MKNLIKKWLGITELETKVKENKDMIDSLTTVHGGRLDLHRNDISDVMTSIGDVSKIVAENKLNIDYALKELSKLTPKKPAKPRYKMPAEIEKSILAEVKKASKKKPTKKK